MDKPVVQQLYDTVFKRIVESGHDVYHLPPDETAPYPLVILRRPSNIFERTKSSISGQYAMNIDIFGTEHQDVHIITEDVLKLVDLPIELTNGTRLIVRWKASQVRNLDGVDFNLFRNLIELEFIQKI